MSDRPLNGMVRLHGETLAPTRRGLLVGGGGLAASALLSRRAWASASAPADRRFITIVLRGGMDGLSAVAPVGDPDYEALRSGIAISAKGDLPAFALDGFFALHPSMPNLARLYRDKQALVVHACASPYRERSHFDGQDVLESGQPGPGSTKSGWMNRVLACLPKGDRKDVASLGVGIGPILPLLMRGGEPVLGWAPPELPHVDDAVFDLMATVTAGREPGMEQALMAGRRADRIANPRSGGAEAAGTRRAADVMTRSVAGMARLLVADGGPRLAALAIDDWDTHANEGGARGTLANHLHRLDDALAVLQSELGAAWQHTVVTIITEFGRTARINGTGGTDHGTATVAFLVGGGVRGGRVIADWPGLTTAALHKGRDLMPTVDLRSVLKGVLLEHYDITAEVLAREIFPESQGIPPMRGLLV